MVLVPGEGGKGEARGLGDYGCGGFFSLHLFNVHESCEGRGFLGYHYTTGLGMCESGEMNGVKEKKKKGDILFLTRIVQYIECALLGGYIRGSIGIVRYHFTFYFVELT